jgi:hypothetical protein
MTLESKISEFSGRQKFLTAAYVVFGRSPYTKENRILLLDDEINNNISIEGVKQIDVKIGAFKESIQAKKPEVIVTPYRIAAIGRLSSVSSISATVIAKAAGMLEEAKNHEKPPKMFSPF